MEADLFSSTLKMYRECNFSFEQTIIGSCLHYLVLLSRTEADFGGGFWRRFFWRRILEADLILEADFGGGFFLEADSGGGFDFGGGFWRRIFFGGGFGSVGGGFL